MKNQIHVAVCQMTSVDDVTSNVASIKSNLEKIKSEKPETQIAFFPENALYMRIQEGEKIKGLTLSDPLLQVLQSDAKRLGIAIHLGSVPLKLENKLTNASVFISAVGDISSTYDKIHLFDIDLDGQRPIRESDVFKHGEKPALLEFADWKLGQTICYDVRFSELFSVYAKKGVDVILVPAAFLPETGRAHWEILLRARAIESQCYIIAAAQAGEHVSTHGSARRKTYGHSLIVAPWGEIIAQGSADQAQVLFATLERSEIKKVRKQIPMQSHRRI